jgi:nucleoside phosphorylase
MARMTADAFGYLNRTTPFLVYLASNFEYRTCIKWLKENKALEIHQSTRIDETSLIDYFFFNGEKIAIVKGQALGGGTMGGVDDTLPAALSILTGTQYILSIGCCGALTDKTASKKESQYRFGDVIIPDKVFDGSYWKITEKGAFSRGDIYQNQRIINAFNKKYDEFVSLAERTHDFRISIDKVFSQTCLLSREDIAKWITSLDPDSKALEMELSNIARIAESHHLQWFFAKGYSDACTKKHDQENQKKAIINAAEIVFSAITENSIFPHKKGKVWISGAIDGKENDIVKAQSVTRSLSNLLFDSQYQIVNGYGLNIGSAIIAAAYDYQQNQGEPIADLLEIDPFPRIYPFSEESQITWFKTLNRKLLARACGLHLLLYGNKSGSSVPTSGMEEEFRMGGGEFIKIPIESTGFSSGYFAKQIISSTSSDSNVLTSIPNLK